MRGVSGGAIQLLLVEDEPAEAILVQRLLRSCRPGMFTVTHVQTMKQARREMNSAKYHVVLLDLNLPDSAPMETIVHGCGHASTIPVVILSGRDDLKEMAADLKIPYFLIKGELDPAKLTRTLFKAMRDAGMIRVSAESDTCSVDAVEG